MTKIHDFTVTSGRFLLSMTWRHYGTATNKQTNDDMSQQRALPLNLSARKYKLDNSIDIISGQEISGLDFRSISAQEYLASVSLEARALPDVHIATDPETVIIAPEQSSRLSKPCVPIEGSAAMMHYLLSSRTVLEPCASSSNLPRNNRLTKDVLEWVDNTMADFSALRSYLDSYAIRGVGSKKSERVPVPPMRDGVGWHEFCLGFDEAQGNVGGYFEDKSKDDDLSIIHVQKSPTNEQTLVDDIHTWKINLPERGNIPSVELLLQMDQVMTRRVLAHQMRWIEEDWSMTDARGAWIYALLARLSKPLHREDAAMLRRLLKKLCRLRNSVKQDVVAVVNILIAIVGRYFEQAPYDELFKL